MKIIDLIILKKKWVKVKFGVEYDKSYMKLYVVVIFFNFYS